MDLTQMVLAVWKKLKSTHLNIPNNFCFNNFAQKSIPGVVLAEVLQEPVGASLWCLDLTLMVLAVRKKLKSTHLNILNNFCFNNFAQKSIYGDVRAQVLQVLVSGQAHGVGENPESLPEGQVGHSRQHLGQP